MSVKRKLFNSIENWSFKKRYTFQLPCMFQSFIIKCWGGEQGIQPIELTDLKYHTINKYDIREHALFAIWFPMLKTLPGSQQLLNSSYKMNKKKDENEERAQENSEEKHTCIIRWTSTSKAFICSEEGDGTDQKQPVAKALQSLWVHAAGVLSVPWAVCHTPRGLCVATSAPHPDPRWDTPLPRVSLCIPRPIYAKSICNSTALNIM